MRTLLKDYASEPGALQIVGSSSTRGRRFGGGQEVILDLRWIDEDSLARLHRLVRDDVTMEVCSKFFLSIAKCLAYKDRQAGSSSIVEESI